VGERLGEGGGGPTHPGPVTAELRKTLVDIQFGRAADTFGWTRKLV
jgi:branched-chain amino acid aminotransferase